MSQSTKLMLKFTAIVLVLFALGIRWRYIIIPVLNVSQFWLVVGAFFLLLITGG
ncbi:MAG: hypothetical protein AAFP93_01955 [Bacteroidota bacterium]